MDGHLHALTLHTITPPRSREASFVLEMGTTRLALTVSGLEDPTKVRALMGALETKEPGALNACLPVLVREVLQRGTEAYTELSNIGDDHYDSRGRRERIGYEHLYGHENVKTSSGGFPVSAFSVRVETGEWHRALDLLRRRLEELGINTTPA